MYDCSSDIGDFALDFLASSGETRPSTLGGDFLRLKHFFRNSKFNVTDGEYYVVVDDEFDSNGTCVVDSVNGIDLLCTIPRGSGGHAEFKLYTEHTSLGMALSILSCNVGYNNPIITNVTGCPNEMCSRAGGDTITVYGSNFGNDQAVVFIDGFPCEDVMHVSEQNISGCKGDLLNDDRTCDLMLRCVTPAMRVLHTFNEHISVVQKDLYQDEDKVPGFHYLPCEKGTSRFSFKIYSPNKSRVSKYTGTHQDTINIQGAVDLTFVNCTSCEPGTFSDMLSSISCTLCSPGTYTSMTRSTICTFCPAGRFSNKEGASACKMCNNYETSDEGSDQCYACEFMYMGSTDCSQPVVGILLGVFGSAVLIVTCFVGIRAYRKKDAETRLLKNEAIHLKSDLNAATLKELEAKHDVEALTDASRIEWSSIELNKKPFARGM